MRATDLTDWLEGLRHLRRPSGVTRVQTELVMAADGLLAPVAFAGGAWREFPRAAMAQAMRRCGGAGSHQDDDWQALVDETQALAATAAPFEFAAGDWLLGIGASWWLPGHAARILALKASRGVAYANFVHDVLPLTVPEHCSAALVRAFAQHFATICLLADRVVTNSETSARDFAQWQRRLLPGVTIPGDVLRLDATDARPLAGDRGGFVLAVGTVESRKNQHGLLRAWLRLIRTHGEEAVPKLVIVGLHGFRAEQVEELRDASPELRRRVELRQAVGDDALERLYAGCLFTVFNSHAEGWGLPVSESLARGRLVVTTDLPVLREAGGDQAIYVEPENVPALAEACWALIREPAAREAREAALRAAPPPPSWRALAERCAGFLSAAPTMVLDRARLPAGQTIPAGLPPTPDLPALLPAWLSSGALLRQGQGWSHQEEWGCWAVSPGEVALRLPLDAGWRAPGVRLSLRVMHPPGGIAMRARARGGAWVEWRLDAERELVLDAPWPADDVLEVEFDVGDGVACPPDHRRLGFGLRSLMVEPAPISLLARLNPLRKP